MEGGDGAVPLWGDRREGYDLDRFDLTKDHVAPVKDKEDLESEKIQGEEEEASHVAPGKDKDPPPQPEPARKKIQGEEEALPDAAMSVAPFYRDPDPEAPEYLDNMTKFYLEASRRLPIAQMPRLAGVLSCGGLLLGFNDPVTNIIFNAIYLMGKSSDFGLLPPGADPVNKASYVDIARRSRAALVAFMVFYFRHLTEAQAKRYLRAARHDLALAIGLVEWHRTGGFDLPSPDCSRTKTALWYAATDADMLLRDPRDLVRLLASRFPRHLLDPVLDDLRRGEQLSVGRVNDILNLLRHPWSPPPPLPAPTPGTFRDADGNLTIIANVAQGLFSTTTVARDHVAALNNNTTDNILTTTTFRWHHTRSDHDNDDELASLAYLSNSSDTESRLRAFLSTNTALQLQPDTNSLKMCLLDTIHGLYIEALAMLPSDHQPRLLRAMLAGGHCYGVMEDPVFNIVINSIWYSAHFPHPGDDDEDILIKATCSMTRSASSSLHGLIAILRNDRSVTEQEAVACLCTNNHNLSHLMMTMSSSLNQHALAAAAEAAKHPQPAALVAFLMTLLTPEKHDRLCSLLMAKRALSDADFKELNTMIAGSDVAAAPVQRMAMTPDLGQSALNTMPATPVRGFRATTTPNPFQSAVVSLTAERVTFPAMYQPSILGFNTIPDAPVRPGDYVRTKLEELLQCNNPLGPRYKVGVICGVESRICSAYSRDTTCYHVNFLASISADVSNRATTSTPESKLYFAEFWNRCDHQVEQSMKPPVCCPIEDCHAFPGRCFICEGGSVEIVHPPYGNYFMGHDIPTD